ncbi:MAG: peptidylprolyl isomerase [Desulfosarcinaceae bacterium]
MSISDGSTVSIEYTLTLDSGQVVDSNVGQKPLTFQQGQGQIITGLESELLGMETGDEKTVTVSPEDGYGPVREEAMLTFKRDQLPEDAQEVGAQIQAQGPNGQTLQGKVASLTDEKATLDFNHPLAGENLHFEVKILEVA